MLCATYANEDDILDDGIACAAHCCVWYRDASGTGGGEERFENEEYARSRIDVYLYHMYRLAISSA